MFREMRRIKQQLSEEEDIEILKRGTAGTLALTLEDGYPYSVPVSYVYDNGRILIHGAREGQKFDAVQKNNKASFSVIDLNEIHPEKFTAWYRSVIVFGKIRLVTDEEEMRRDMFILAKKYTPDNDEGCRQEVDVKLARIAVYELKIEHMTGKIANGLMQKLQEEKARQ